MTARASQFFFQLLPTDLCADSNFRHVFLWTGAAEILMSAASSGLAGALAFSVYTQQPYIRLHTNYHPMWQASLFMAAAISLFVKFAVLVIFGAVIVVNDGEIFCACAAEDLDEVEKGNRKSMYRASVLKTYVRGRLYDAGEDNRQAAGPVQLAHARGCAFPCSASFCVPQRQILLSQTSNGSILRQAASKSLKALSYVASGRASSSKSASDTDAQKPAERRQRRLPVKPSFVARRCFRRRQVSLNRLRHIIAAFPVIQLLTGAASMTFWFSSSDYNADRFDMLHLTQLPSYKLFNSYICFWALDLVHTPIFLLFATWHYARVDWQMQLLSASLFLHEKAIEVPDERLIRHSEDTNRRRRQHAGKMISSTGRHFPSHERCSHCGNALIEADSKRHRRHTANSSNLQIDLTRASQIMSEKPLPAILRSSDARCCNEEQILPRSAHF